MIDTESVLFFYFIVMIRNNFKVMKCIRQIVLARKDAIFSYIDAILIYYYMVLGLQADNAFKFVEHYWKKHSISTQRFYRVANSICA